jgi:L-2,4-diaminobutyrate transaminase
VPGRDRSGQHQHAGHQGDGGDGAHRDGDLADQLADLLQRDIRGEGLLCALEFVADRDDRKFFDASDKVGARVAAALLSEGVIARAMPQGDIIGFAPPLCLARDEADKIVAAARKAVAAVLPMREHVGTSSNGIR